MQAMVPVYQSPQVGFRVRRFGGHWASWVLMLVLGLSGELRGQTQSCEGVTVAGTNQEPHLSRADGVYVDDRGYIYVADSENHRIQKFAPTSTTASSGTTVAGGNGDGSGANQLGFPSGVFVDRMATSTYSIGRITGFRSSLPTPPQPPRVPP